MKFPLFKLRKVLNKAAAAGFTLMEIVVATTIFALVVTSLLALFNYTLKINRRTEALRQATQGMRDFVEYVAKEVRNGGMDYGIINGTTKSANYPIGPCNSSPGTNTYLEDSNKLGVFTDEGDEACIYFGDTSGTYLGSYVNTCPAGQKCTIVLKKPGGITEILNPPNFEVAYLNFLIRPVCDPYMPTCPAWDGVSAPQLPRWQPFVAMSMVFITTLPTGEVVTIPYQTSVSTNNTNIPN